MAKGLSERRRAPTPAAMAALLDGLGRRWALRVVWELRGGARTFRALRSDCDAVSPGVLQRRLHELRAAGIVEKVPRVGYRLSIAGEELCTDLEALARWAEHHGRAQRRDKRL